MKFVQFVALSRFMISKKTSSSHINIRPLSPTTIIIKIRKKINCSSNVGKSDESWLGKLKLKKSTADLEDASKGTGTRGPFAQDKDNFNAPPEEAHALKRARGSARPLR